MNITIVTAFFDIGRGDWTPDKGLPHYLQRTTETYLERFSYLAQLKNDMVIFTSPDLCDRIRELRKGKPNTVVIPTTLDRYQDIKDAISKVQSNPNYQANIHPSQVKNPEYWNADYVLVNFLKSQFVVDAIDKGFVRTDLAAWLDFGYCRTEDKVPPSHKWSYDFDTNKIHLFNYKDYNGISINYVISMNDVYILGAKIVGGKKVWPKFRDLMNNSLNLLLQKDLVDDDQTLMLISTLLQPSLFKMHKIPDHQLGLDPFIILKDFNNQYERYHNF